MYVYIYIQYVHTLLSLLVQCELMMIIIMYDHQSVHHAHCGEWLVRAESPCHLVNTKAQNEINKNHKLTQ